MNDIIFIFLIVNLSSNEYSSHISQIMNSSTWINHINGYSEGRGQKVKLSFFLTNTKGLK